MKSKIFKLLMATIISFFSILLFGCTKSVIKGHLVFQPSEVELPGVYIDEWPGDTTSVAICILPQVIPEPCVYEKPDIDGTSEDPGDTISFSFEDLRWGA